MPCFLIEHEFFCKFSTPLRRVNRSGHWINWNWRFNYDRKRHSYLYLSLNVTFASLILSSSLSTAPYFTLSPYYSSNFSLRPLCYSLSSFLIVCDVILSFYVLSPTFIVYLSPLLIYSCSFPISFLPSFRPSLSFPQSRPNWLLLPPSLPLSLSLSLSLSPSLSLLPSTQTAFLLPARTRTHDQIIIGLIEICNYLSYLPLSLSLSLSPHPLVLSLYTICPPLMTVRSGMERKTVGTWRGNAGNRVDILKKKEA